MPNECRHNPFHDLHKALRLGHCRMLAALGAHDFADAASTAELLAGFGGLLALNRRHAEAEQAELDRAVSKAPEIAAHAKQDHAGHLAALAELQSLVRSVQVAAPARRNIAGQSLYRCYALFAASDMARMDAEETALLGLLHQALTDDELRDMEGRILRTLSRDELETCMSLSGPAFSPSERPAALAKLTTAIASQPASPAG
ncbi:hypothetical protein [Aestuariivirga sp.]|uniref:hypothetical protein n=1 Tax=Aestuariivirga sp. TaxID=2650926 RepID=UPI00391BCA64